MVKYTQIIRRQHQTNCLSVYDHFVGLKLKGLRAKCYTSRGGSRAAETSKMERFALIVNYYHKAFHLGCCSSSRSASDFTSAQSQIYPCYLPVNHILPISIDVRNRSSHSIRINFSIFTCKTSVFAIARIKLSAYISVTEKCFEVHKILRL